MPIGLKYKKINLPFKYPFTISKGTKTHQPSLLVELDFFNRKGYGEAPAITYYDITVEDMIADLEAKRHVLESYNFNDAERFWHFLHHLFPKNPFLVCALDIAAWDLQGKLRNKPLHQLWNLDTSLAPATDYTIGIAEPDIMIKKMLEKPWPLYKIKVGFENDVDIIKALRKHTDAPFCVDANAGWTADEALEKIPLLKAQGVIFVEQPLAKTDWDGMKLLKDANILPLFADEACVFEKDVDACAPFFDGINIKLTKCSGITPALRMIKRAKELNLQVMVGCMNECTVGSAAIAHLAPMLHYVDMDGPLLLAEDVASGVAYDFGKIQYNNQPGLGITMLEPF
jgi:L-Ala-D/L-Glu epimerase